MELLITVVAIYYGLKFIAHLMQQGSVKAAGDELDQSLDSAAGNTKSCVVQGCRYYLLLCLVSILSSLVFGFIFWLLGH
jgi:hypothetical protein